MARRVVLCSLLLTFSVALDIAKAQGIIFPGAGAVNRSMAGVSTAAPMDAAGATYWNPAAISGLRYNEVFVGADLMYADTFMGAAAEESGRFGENRSNSGLAASPALALVYRPGDSTFSYGLNVTSLVGRNIDFPGSEFNPILTAYDPPNSFGLGPVSTQMSGLQISPMLSKWVTDSWAVGGGVSINSMSLALDPALWASPNPNGTLPPATHSRPYWGFGFQGGVYYSSDSDWKFGASFKSKARYETFNYSSKDEKGNARNLTLDVSLPMILSFGVSYEGLDRAVIASDVRFLDYKNTDLFGTSPGRGGLGWESIWSFAVGGRYTINDILKAQFGFSLNGNPVPEAATVFNMQMPAINKFTISGGMSIDMTERIELTASVVYAPQHKIQGTILEIPGTAIQIKQDLTTINVGFNFRI
jgi:long-chain fatty acid transport protein